MSNDKLVDHLAAKTQASQIAALRHAAGLLAVSLRCGGGTLDPTTWRLLDRYCGFLVSVRRYGRVFPLRPTEDDILGWLIECVPLIAAHSGELFPGIWHSPETHDFHCDLNQLIEDRSLALELGDKEEQQRIRDLNTNQSFVVPRRAWTSRSLEPGVAE